MYTTEGIVLKKTAVGEADALFTIYTKDYGKIRAMAQGVKKETAKLKGHLETLNLVQLGFVLGKNGERLTQASLLKHWPTIRVNWNKVSAINRVTDWIDRGCMVGEKDTELWSLLINNFQYIESMNNFTVLDFTRTIRAFEKEFSSILGYGEKSLKNIEYINNV
ncbi:MAG: DNA repair protein RecO [bacterium]|nr:DNA repair protein RecO [bacterium]